MKTKKKKKSEELALKQQEEALKEFQESVEFQNMIRGIAVPFGEMLINLGMNPVDFLNSSQGQALLAPAQEAISANFEQARINLADTLGATGFSPQSGLGAAPLGNLLGQEATAQGQNVQNLVAQSLGFGLQGANVLQGQQALAQPVPFGQLGLQATGAISSGQELPLALAGAGLGAAGTVLGGFTQPRPGGGTP